MFVVWFDLFVVSNSLGIVSIVVIYVVYVICVVEVCLWLFVMPFY